MRQAARQSQFTGSFLDAQWAKQFALGFLLQEFFPSEHHRLRPNARFAAATPDRILSLQEELSHTWKLPVKPLDATSTTNILRVLGRYATGQSGLSLEALAVLDAAVVPLGHRSLQDPLEMRLLMENVSFVQPGDNLRRLVFRGDLHFAPAANSMLDEHLNPVDPYDAIRVSTSENVYAIDSATTSEVDDAIGVSFDAQGVEWFTVYVSDATVHCPFDSTLERITARTLTTTNYLPEDVFFMLPQPIIEAATLREDRPCRTFNITFRVHPDTAELFDYRVEVGRVTNLRRITYDALQELIDAASRTPLSQTPAWVTSEDIRKLHRIHDVARLRLDKRLARSSQRIESNLPEPLIRVKGTTVVSVTDQILSTKDARIAVAELMIAANEVCSRVAQASSLTIPFRGTRMLSRDHVMAKEYVPPRGLVSLDRAVTVADSGNQSSAQPTLETSGAGAPSMTTPTPGADVREGFAQAIFRNISSLSGVTRAMYSHEPLLHNGLETFYYTHSTSPLRRYADMLVHHQLKVYTALKQHGKRFDELIPEYQMATLCSMISAKQEQCALLQDASSRFWLLQYIAVNLLKEGQNPNRLLSCLVGSTFRLDHAPAAYRSLPDAPLASNGSRSRVLRDHSTGHYAFVSDVYLPELQMTHVVFHNRSDARVGTTLNCRVLRVEPDLNILDLDIVEVLPFEENAEAIMRRALMPASDA